MAETIFNLKLSLYLKNQNFRFFDKLHCLRFTIYPNILYKMANKFNLYHREQEVVKMIFVIYLYSKYMYTADSLRGDKFVFAFSLLNFILSDGIWPQDDGLNYQSKNESGSTWENPKVLLYFISDRKLYLKYNLWPLKKLIDSFRIFLITGSSNIEKLLFSLA